MHGRVQVLTGVADQPLDHGTHISTGPTLDLRLGHFPKKEVGVEQAQCGCVGLLRNTPWACISFYRMSFRLRTSPSPTSGPSCSRRPLAGAIGAGHRSDVLTRSILVRRGILGQSIPSTQRPKRLGRVRLCGSWASAKRWASHMPPRSDSKDLGSDTRTDALSPPVLKGALSVRYHPAAPRPHNAACQQRKSAVVTLNLTVDPRRRRSAPARSRCSACRRRLCPRRSPRADYWNSPGRVGTEPPARRRLSVDRQIPPRPRRLPHQR